MNGHGKNPIEDPHAQLVRRAVSGEKGAFDAIVLEFSDRVRGVAIRMLGDAFEAEDLAQEVFVAVYCALPKFRAESKLSTWILRITRNHCLNRIKSKSRKVKGNDRLTRDADSLQNLPGVVRSSPGPEAQAISQQTMAQLERAIAELPAEQRWLVVLRDIEDLSYEDIAEVTSLRIGTVKSRLHRARARLAKMLTDLVQEGMEK